MFNPWVILAAVLTVAGLTGGAYIKGRQDGVKIERVTWEARDNRALREAQDQIVALTTRNTTLERTFTDQIAELAVKAAKEKQDAEARTRRAVANARDLVLRQQPTCPGVGGGNPGSETGTGPSGGDAPSAGCVIPKSAVQDLQQLVGDCDGWVSRFALAKQVIIKDRELCK